MQTSTFFSDVLDVILNKSDIKFKFYSASDGNLNAVLLSAGVASFSAQFEEWSTPKPHTTHSNAPFASTIFLEIYEDEASNKFVQFIYNDNVI